MKHFPLSIIALGLLASCDARVNVPAPEGDKTTIINPPAEKKVEKVEKNTTIVTPPAPEKK